MGPKAPVSQFQQDGQVRRAQPAHDADHVGVPDGNYRNQCAPEQEITNSGKRGQHDGRPGGVVGGQPAGDPAERDPAAIQADLDNFAITEAAARDIYAAVLDGESGQIDPEATARHRKRLRDERVRRFGRVSVKRDGTLLHEVTPYLHAKRDDRGAFWACARCSTELGPIEDNYKLGCNREDRHVSASNPLIGEPRDFINEDVEFRQFSCPGCGALIENEVAVASDPVLEDIRLACGGSATETA